MRVFIFYSNTVRTDGKFKDLYSAGRLDVVLNSIIHTFFVSHGLRKNVIFELSLNGPPYPPKRIKLVSNPNTPWSKKDIATLLSSALKKYLKKKHPIEAFPGVFVDSKSFRDIINEYIDNERNIYVLDEKGEDINDVTIENPVFVVGDFLGIPKKEKKWLKDKSTFVSLGDIPYFSSQVIVILNWILDRMNYYKDFWDTSDKFKY